MNAITIADMSEWWDNFDKTLYLQILAAKII